MAGLATEKTSSVSFRFVSDSLKSEAVECAAKISPLNPPIPSILANSKTRKKSGEKNKKIQISVFKGKEARLNRAILTVLKNSNPQIIFDITKAVRMQRGLNKTKYSIVNRRVRALEKQGFLKEAGCRYTHTGVLGRLFQPTVKAYVALLFDQLDPDKFIKEADENILQTQITNLTLFFQNTI